MTRRLTAERLRHLTLKRQFPKVRGRGVPAVTELYRRLGPIQTQVPRAAHLSLAARLPGVTNAAITEAFETHAVVKATNIRGTVHTSTAEQHEWLAAVALHPRTLLLRNYLKLQRALPTDVTDEVERFTQGEWRERQTIVDHVRVWLSEHESTASAEALSDTGPESLVWGHAALIRRPRDQRWDKRTDVWHRNAADLLPRTGVGAHEATQHLVRVHLGAYGPATRRDVAWWMGSRLTEIDRAVTALGDEVVRLEGADGVTYLDLADPPGGGLADPGLRLLPEFDGLLLGYEGPARGRFAQLEHLDRLWARVNGLFSPAVLHEGRIVACWRILTQGRRQDVRVDMLPGHPRLPDDLFAGPLADLRSALGLEITDLRVLDAE